VIHFFLGQVSVQLVAIDDLPGIGDYTADTGKTKCTYRSQQDQHNPKAHGYFFADCQVFPVHVSPPCFFYP